MTIWYRGEIWKVKGEARSIDNGSIEYVIVRPGQVLVVPAGKCRRV